jgi:hypothetical protein
VLKYRSEASEEGQAQTQFVYTPIAPTDLTNDWHLHNYLDRATAPFTGQVSLEERQTERARLHVELQATIAAYEEVGHARSEAVALAIKNHPLLPQTGATSASPQTSETTFDIGARMLFVWFAGQIMVIVACLPLIIRDLKATEDKSLEDLVWNVPLLMWGIILPLLVGFGVTYKAKWTPTLKPVLGGCTLLALAVLLESAGMAKDAKAEHGWIVFAIDIAVALWHGLLCWVGALVAMIVRKRLRSHSL